MLTPQTRHATSPRGSITLEVIIAFGLFALSIGSIIITHYSLGEILTDADLDQHALYHAEDALAQTHSSLQKNFNSTLLSSTNLNPYQEEIGSQFEHPFMQRVEVTEHWTSNPLRSQHTTLSTLIADHSSLLGTSPCPALATNSTSFALLGSIDIGPNFHGTDVEVKGNHAYLTTYTAGTGSSSADADFFIINITDSSHPTIEGRLNTGPGLAAVRVIGNYAYVANTSRTAQLQIINIQDPERPSLAASFKLPGVSGSGLQGTGNSIAYADNRVFIGTTKATGPELHAIDVHNPLVPLELGSWESQTLINGITPRGSNLYVSTPTADQVHILNISDPGHISESRHFSPSDASSNSGQGVLLVGSEMIFSRNASGASSASSQQIFFLDATDQDHFTILHSLHIGSSVYGMVSHTGRLALATNNTTHSLQLWDVRNTSTSTRLSTLHLSAPPIGLACDETNIVAALDGSPAFQIIGLSP